MVISVILHLLIQMKREVAPISASSTPEELEKMTLEEFVKIGGWFE